MIYNSVALGGQFSGSFWRLLEIGNNGAHLLDVPSLWGDQCAFWRSGWGELEEFCHL